MEWAQLMAAGNAAVGKINPPMRRTVGPFASRASRAQAGRRAVDGKVINMRSFFDVAPEISKNVPMLIGSVSEEGNRMLSRPTEEEWHANLAKTYGDDKATAIVAALKKAYPQKEHPDAVVYVQWHLRVERPLHAQQRRENGQIEA